MASEILRNLPSVLHIIDLTVLLGEENLVTVVFLSLLHIDERVAWTGDEYRHASLIEGVVGDLEVAERAINRPLIANAGLRDEFLTLPVPQEHLPIGLTRQRHNHSLLLVAEGAGNELLRVVGIAVLDLLWQSLLFLVIALVGHVEDRKLALVASCRTFADRNVLLTLGNGDMSDSLSVART